MNNRRCVVEGCSRFSRANNYCVRHYKEKLESGKVVLPAIDETSFWSRVEKTSDCWFWTGYTHHGYGIYYIGPFGNRAHRIAWELTYGEKLDEVHLDHMCHNTRCVNPSHLRITTPAQNGQNRKAANTNSTTGVRGVYRTKMGKPYLASAKKNGEYVYLGRFDTLHEAEAVVTRWRREHMPYSIKDQAPSGAFFSADVEAG